VARTYKTSKADFELFKKHVGKWVDVFGLKCWQLHFTTETLANERAQIRYNLIHRQAIFALNTEFREYEDISIDKALIERTAFHEVMELFLAPLVGMIEQRFALGVDDITEATHMIIRTLENVVWEGGTHVK